MVTEHKFTGQKLDGTGLQYYNARYYDPAIGVFLSPDTLVPDATGVFSYNRFMYARGNPIRYSDPTGHIEFCSEPSSCVGGSPVGGGGSSGAISFSGGGGGSGSAARTTIQLAVDTATVIIGTSQVVESFQESVPLLQPKAEVTGIPLADQTPQSASWPTSFEAPGQQVLADPLVETPSVDGLIVPADARPAKYGPFYRVKSSTQKSEDASLIESSGILKGGPARSSTIPSAKAHARLPANATDYIEFYTDVEPSSVSPNFITGTLVALA